MICIVDSKKRGRPKLSYEIMDINMKTLITRIRCKDEQNNEI